MGGINQIVISGAKTDCAYNRIVKPLLDIFFSLIIILLACPFLFLLALMIKMDSKGPVFFKQDRIGKDGASFLIIKFRTMYADVPKQGFSPRSKGDPRITRIGKFLRKTSLDELPQLFNILKGDMSFIGPRPEQRFIVEKYYSDYERQRLVVKPGITGLWQVSMERDKLIHKNLHYDFTYINQISFLVDLKIIMKTFLVMFKSNTY